jgi:Uri superfamily endonuclease
LDGFKISYLTALLGAIDHFDKIEDHTFRNIKPRWWFHIDFLLENTIKICSFDLHLVDFETKFSSEGKESAK